jgi:5-formyltetrahydrofolate cyclo-ligase
MTPEEERCEDWLKAAITANIKDKRILHKIQDQCMDFLRVPEDNRIIYIVLIKSEIKTIALIEKLKKEEEEKIGKKRNN